jgi:Carboxypeptidase regulatory-like domain
MSQLEKENQMRFRTHSSWIRCGVVVQVVGLCLFLLVGVADAQQAAGVLGQITDENGGVLPGVMVTITSPVLQVPSVTAVTDERGEYRVTPLPIGTYTVEYALQGFQTMRQEGLRLEIGLQAKLDQVLKLGSLAESIVVRGTSPVVDVTSTGSSTQFNRETLELTPTSRNGIISLGAQAPGVKGRIDIGGGTVGDPPEFKAFGQKWGEYISAEGVETSHPGAGATSGNYFNYDAIDEAQVQSLSNGPEIASYGVAITMVVKSGGNDFHGSGALAYTGKRLQSDNIDQTLRDQGVTSGNPLVNRTDRGGDLGGRILRDKLWFYGAGRFREQRRLQLGGFKPDGTQVEGYVSELTENHKFSYQLNASNRFVYWNEWSRKQTKSDNVNEFVAWESQGDRTHPGLLSQAWKGEWQGTAGRSLVTSLLFGRWAWSQASGTGPKRNNEALEDQGIPHGLEALLLDDEDHGGGRPAARDIGTQKVWGSSAGGNIQDTGKHYAKGTLNWYRPDFFAGNHEFKTGFDYAPLWSINGTPSRGKAGDYQLVFNNGAPTQIDLFNSPVTPETDVSYLGVFLNDTWTIARRLTLNLGARYERDNPVIPAQCRIAGSWPFSPVACIDKVQFNKYASVAPRLYFSWDVTGRAKTVVKGGWGRFDAQRIYDLLGHANPIRSYTSTYRWRDLNSNQDYDAGEVNLDPNGPDFLSSNVPATGEPNPNEKRPGADQFSLSLERELAACISGPSTKTDFLTPGGLPKPTTFRSRIRIPAPTTA